MEERRVKSNRGEWEVRRPVRLRLRGVEGRCRELEFEGLGMVHFDGNVPVTSGLSTSKAFNWRPGIESDQSSCTNGKEPRVCQSLGTFFWLFFPWNCVVSKSQPFSAACTPHRDVAIACLTVVLRPEGYTYLLCDFRKTSPIVFYFFIPLPN